MFAPVTVKTRPVNTRRPKTDDLSARARKLHFSSIVVDTHADTTQRLIDGDFDLATRDPKGSVDIPRMKEGGVDAIFFSIWIPSKVTGPIAVKRATATNPGSSRPSPANIPPTSLSPPPPPKSATSANKTRSRCSSASRAAT